MINQVLAFCARHGKFILIAGLLAGFLLPDIAKILQNYLPHLVALLLVLAAIRIPPQALLGTHKGNVEVLLVTLIFQIIVPLVLIVLFSVLSIEGPIALAIVVMASAASIAGGANLVVLSNADPAPALRLLIVSTACLPVTILPVFLLLPQLGSASVIIGAAAKLLLLVGAAAAIAGMFRRFILPNPDKRDLTSIDGLSAIVMAIVVVGLMAAVGPAFRETPQLAISTLLVACAANFGLQAIAYLVLRDSKFEKVRISFTIGAGNRNMALFLSSLPFAVTEPLLLFIGCYQIPMYLTPVFIRFLQTLGRKT